MAVFIYASGPWTVLEELSSGLESRPGESCLQDSSADVDVGQLPEEAKHRFQNWIDVMGWVEEDEAKLDRPEQGWLWIHRSA